MKQSFRRFLAGMLIVIMVLFITPFSAVAVGETASPGVGAINGSGSPPETEAAAILGISQTQVNTLKEAMFNTIRNFETVCTIESYGIVYSQEVNDCLSGLISDTAPELFQINNWTFYHRTATDNVITRIEFTEYKYSRQEYETMLHQCKQVREFLTYDLVDNDDLSPLQKALLLHDRLAVWVDYDQAMYEADTVPYVDHTMYGALWNSVAVCDGYAEAYTYLLEAVGIESYVCRSDTLDHAWNIVKLYGDWYHVDVTWDDPIGDITGRVTHKNFLRSSDGIYATGHEAFDYDTTPQSDYFDQNWPWATSDTAFQYVNGTLYYVDNQKEELRHWEGDSLYTDISVADTWWISQSRFWTKNYTRLSADGDYLYYSLAQSVHRFDPKTGTSEPLHYPDFSQRPYHNIFGMKVAWNVLYCDIWDDPSFEADTKESAQELAQYQENEALYILISTQPTKVVYSQGESLDTSGMELKVRFSDGTVEYVTDGFTVRGYDPQVMGKQTLTVVYGDRSATFTVTVNQGVTHQPQVKQGDADGDGKINSTDARMVLQYAVKKIPAGSLNVTAVDVDHNGKVDSTDARLILQFAVGKIKQL